MEEYIARRRKFVNLRKKPKRKESDYTLSNRYERESKKGFMTLITNIKVTMEQIEKYSPVWYNWLYNLFNPTSTKQANKTIYLEDIPFYSSTLLREYEDIFLAITEKQNPFSFDFKKHSLKFSPKIASIKSLDSKFIESIQDYGAFYYELPKQYTFFEFTIEDKQILSNVEIKLVKSKAITLPKNVIYWGYVNQNSKPIFLNYYSLDEVDSKKKLNPIDRKRLLENNLRERGFITNFVEGKMVWDLEQIPLKKDVLIMSSREGLFRSVILKKD